jgi:hypothetical protein
MKRRRDQDYRGQKTTVDWSRLVYMARRNRPGAMEVLQDAVLTYFPKQFGKAQVEARRRSKRIKNQTPRHLQGTREEETWKQNVYVLFKPRIARRRFESRKTRIAHHYQTSFEATTRRLETTIKKKKVSNLPHPKKPPFSFASAEDMDEDATIPEFIAQQIPIWSTRDKLRLLNFGTRRGWR